jgi:Bacterial Ig-like domain (group 2)
VKRWARLLPLVAAVACSGLDEGEGGVVSLEVEFPELRTLEIGEQVQLAARALNADGDVVDATIAWRVTNPALTVDGTGLVTGVAVGTGDVQAAVGSLTSEQVDFTIILRTDTLIIEGDSVLTIQRVAVPPETATLPVRLESFDPVGPVPSRPVIFTIVQPVAGATPLVELVGAGQGDTVNTAANGAASVTLAAVAGQIPPDTAIVQIQATRPRGAPVPGSGQRFIVLFQ